MVIVSKRLKHFAKQYVRRWESWSISIYETNSSLKLQPADRVKNPILTARDVTDLQADFVADPFMVNEEGIWHLFFEVLNSKDDLGYIALATSSDGIQWTYQKVVLKEPFHLSYPYVFKWNQNYYMIPETYQAKEVRLYRATHFPDQWSLESVLLKGSDYIDSSLVYFQDRWWLFSSTTANDVLHLYYAESLVGDWIEHPSSPLLTNNPHSSRPAGRIIHWNGQLLRFAQDDEPIYGRRVYAFLITELTPDSYAEQPIATGKPILDASGSGWNAKGMHHIDLHQVNHDQWLACVDGKGRDSLQILNVRIY